MRITFFYICECGCNWSQSLNPAGLSFLDSSCKCPSCGEENEAQEQELS